MSDEEPRKRKRFIVSTPKKPKKKAKKKKYTRSRGDAVDVCKKCGSVVHFYESLVRKSSHGGKRGFIWNNPDGTPHRCKVVVRNLDPDTLEEI